MDELVSSGNAPFLVAICVMVVIGALEGLSLLIGGGLSHHLDSFFAPDLDHGPPAFSADGLLGWLHVGRAPILVLIVIFLMGFAIGGLVLQWAISGLVGQPLPPLIASLIAGVFAVPVVHILGGRIARQSEKRGLEGVFFVLLVPQRPAANGQDHRAVTLHERGECGLILTGTIGTQQITVRQVSRSWWR